MEEENRCYIDIREVIFFMNRRRQILLEIDFSDILIAKEKVRVTLFLILF